MVEPGSPLLAFSDHAAELVERVASSIVAVDGGGRWPSSGIHWRSGVIVTAEEVLERDENIKLTLPGGRVANASLAGRDPTTDVAVLRFQPDGLPVATTAEAQLRAGQARNAQLLSISQHHESQLRGLCYRFGPTVSIELGEYRSDMKLGGVERNTQATGNRFV